MSSPDRRFLDALFSAIDSSDAVRFADFLAEDALFRFGSAPPVHGRTAIRNAVAGFFSSIAGCRHTVHKVWSGPDTLVCEGEVTYRRLDGSEISLPFADTFERRDKLITGYRIYIDIAPLYAK
ncbi:MAG TPA: nuclear transport factor 2 family protein [Woeseiaceae bacterium]|nr:nuclear transport factor 2 family protein [Woeseiaceae bacterium]